MSRRIFTIGIVVILLMSCSPSKGEILFQEAAPNRFYPEYHALIFDGQVIVVTWNNHIPDRPKDDQREILNLTIEEDYLLIDELWYAEFDNDLIVVYETTNFDYSSSYAARIDMHEKSTIWLTPIKTFNIGEPMIRGQHLYVTAIGLVAKLDLKTGEYIWKHSDLYDEQTQDFNDFDKPIFDEGRIIFQGNNHFSDIAKRIEVDDRTGEVIGIFTTEKSSLDGFQATSTPSPMLCESVYLGSGKGLTVELKKGCYYHFRYPCSECQENELDTIAIYYTGNAFRIVVPEGSVWQYGDEVDLRSNVCKAKYWDDGWPSELPWFLVIPGAQWLTPCG